MRLWGLRYWQPYEETAAYCFDKYKMYQYLTACGIKTVPTYGSLADFEVAHGKGLIDFPVFVKPGPGAAALVARRIDSHAELALAMSEDSSLIIQKLMLGIDLDADVYIDTISHRAVSAFSKRKLETKIGGASKTISFKDEKLFAFIQEIVSRFQFNGPVDMDFFYCDGEYYLSEINPRFGGAYLHAYGAGVDFIKLIDNNVKGIANEARFGDYEDGVVMMMYDSVVICRPEDMAK